MHSVQTVRSKTSKAVQVQLTSEALDILQQRAPMRRSEYINRLILADEERRLAIALLKAAGVVG